MKQHREFLLASASPRRSELLAQMGLRFEVTATDIDESRRGREPPSEFVRRLAAEKAQAGMRMVDRPMPVLGADTVVLLEDRILCKPADRGEAAAMLKALSRCDHEVLSAVALADGNGLPEVMLNCTRVFFSEIPPEFIDWYCTTDEPMDKAGAYAVQGMTGQFIERIEGSYSGVMGLPLHETGVLLRAAGIIS